MPTATITDNTTGTFTGVEDTELDIGAPTTNYGTAGIMVTSNANDEHAIIKFSGLSNIPSSATVSAVTLRLYFDVAPSAGNSLFRRILQNWVEAQATWNVYSTGNSWGTAGCRSDGVDRVGTASATLAHGTSSGYVEFSDAGLTADVQDWIDGTNPNYGWLITDSAGYQELRTSEAADGTRPELVVTYTTGSAVPVLSAGLRRQLNN